MPEEWMADFGLLVRPVMVFFEEIEVDGRRMTSMGIWRMASLAVGLVPFRRWRDGLAIFRRLFTGYL